ncbi:MULTISPECIES: hypothetical protein [unclassified Mesorhizobium]|uniref:hypothetical protein n=1 Tax=unclassified Mesorhizobium TaxID=325217 RepID=UPI0006FDF3C3|nr:MULTISPECIES: hypothetical protein [unclassified Mesorhizobium]KQZ14169.1 hypothetical protein ASD27_08870 [Mesorhizobium sp. Root1471]KQZ36681.1 hypothetical protein ASD44_08860 [Mesorhizobium sp. Root554]MDR7034912.1 hypothetical protein [Mesorhizobium sp. BE184]
MLNKIKTAVLSALIGIGTLAAVPATASADGLYLNFGGDGPRLGIQASDHGNRHWRGDRHDEWRRDRDWRRMCTPGRAVDKAERMGLRRARVVDVGRHTIRVAGRKYNQRVVVVFGRDRNCPVVYR